MAATPKATPAVDAKTPAAAAAPKPAADAKAAAAAAASTTSQWKPRAPHSAEFVYRHPTPGQRPQYWAKPVTLGGPSHAALVAWEQALKEQFPDGEDYLVHEAMLEMLDAFRNGRDIPTPTKKYHKLAAEGLLMTIQCYADHGMQC